MDCDFYVEGTGNIVAPVLLDISESTYSLPEGMTISVELNSCKASVMQSSSDNLTVNMYYAVYEIESINLTGTSMSFDDYSIVTSSNIGLFSGASFTNIGNLTVACSGNTSCVCIDGESVFKNTNVVVDQSTEYGKGVFDIVAGSRVEMSGTMFRYNQHKPYFTYASGSTIMTNNFITNCNPGEYYRRNSGLIRVSVINPATAASIQVCGVTYSAGDGSSSLNDIAHGLMSDIS